MQSKINYLNSLFSEWLFLDQSTNIKTEVTFKSYNAKLIYLMQEICAALLYLYTVWVTQERLLVLGASYLCNPLSYIPHAK